jgi:Cytochrome c554 and c-prime
VLVCTAGDFYGTSDVYNEPKSHFVARMMGEMGYDAVGIGEMDLNFGLASLVRDARSYHLPVVCANLEAKADSLRVRPEGDRAAARAADRLGTAFPPYRVVTAAGTRFGFLGVLSPATKMRTNAGQPLESMTYSLGDAIEAARQVVPELRKRCDVLVVLAHMDDAEARKLAEQVSGIDVIVLGHDPVGRPITQPIVVGGTQIIRATQQGQNVGEFDMELGKDHRIAQSHNLMYQLSAEYPDDPEMAQRLDEFDEQNKQIQKELFAREQLKAAEQTNGHYLGVGVCQSCHPAEFDVYIQTDHARAFSTLASQFVEHDTNCVGCHVTGYGQAGGFVGVRLRGTMTDLVDVQCEACHGPGDEHNRDGSYRERARASCVRCHTPNDDPDFDFDRDWAKIAH